MNRISRKIIIAGGGTGGHLFPAVSIAQQFRSDNLSDRILFVGTGKPIEISVTKNYGFDFQKISAEGIKGRGLADKLKAVLAIGKGVLQSKSIIQSFQPDLVIGMGSYSAAPMVLAAWLKKIPIALCEQNIMPGIANRVLSKFADRIFISFEKTTDGLPEKKTRFTGNPVRGEILQVQRNKKREGEPFTILVLGGSQGAHSINMAMVESLEKLNKFEKLSFIHQTGEADENTVRAAYEINECTSEVRSFFTDMARIYEKVDLVVCRAGATTVAELSCLGIPAIFIPFPHAADNHQFLNAKSLCEAKASEMLLEEKLTGELLAERIIRLVENPGLLEQMAARTKSLGRPDAALEVVKSCRRLIEMNAGA
jgi:UDP-N-acetylglucosamine--N-acetylmuramyl-(pentapeptide) pyrophosphoryl-undecaprenol N-acetylglucosamine transferase